MDYGIQMQNLFKNINNNNNNNNALYLNNNKNQLDFLFNDLNTNGNSDEVNFTTKNNGNYKTEAVKQQLEAKKAEKEAIDDKIEQEQYNLSEIINETNDLSKALSARQEEKMQTAVQNATNRTKNNPSSTFEINFKAEIGYMGVNTFAIDAKVQQADAVGNAIKNLSGQSSALTNNINSLEIQIKAAIKASNLGTIGDVNTSANFEVQDLGSFLTDPETAKMTDAEFKKQVGENFTSVVTVDAVGQISVPIGHDEQSKKTFTELTAELEKRGVSSGPITRTDPIGFKADGVTYDFINDKNKDGKFSGKEEFVGAQKGWEELLQYDANKDGQINGKELDSLQTLATKDGQAKIASASDLGINSIDLNSFKKKNELDANNNILAGTFNVDFKGNKVEGYQTLDTDAFLDKTYGNFFGKEMNKTADVKANNTNNNKAGINDNDTKANDVKDPSFLDKILKAFKSDIEADKKAMKKMEEEYLMYA